MFEEIMESRKQTIEWHPYPDCHPDKDDLYLVALDLDNGGYFVTSLFWSTESGWEIPDYLTDKYGDVYVDSFSHDYFTGWKM